jgi:starch-binding outer membrane protein, SusD/RagB family
MRAITNYIILLFAGPLALISGGCKKFVDIPPPTTQIETESLFSDGASAQSAANGVYAQITLNSLTMLNGGVTLHAGLSADELQNTTSDLSLDQYLNNALVPNEQYVSSRLWSSAYKSIYQANAVLEGLQQSTKIADSIKNQLRGEMLVVRSVEYFYLANLFGDVPLVLSTDYKKNAVMPRTGTDKIYQQLVADLTDAKNLIKDVYPSANRARPNKWTAAALLARVYLYTAKWQEAENESSGVINSGMYSLVSLATVFQSMNSAETIWQMARDNNNTSEGQNFIPSSTSVKPVYALTPFLLNAFQSGDGRRSQWLSSNTVGGMTYYYPYKYKARLSTPASEYYIVLRLAEQYLIRAEARAQQNELPAAVSDLNLIRNRAGLAPLPSTLSQAQVLAAVSQERQTELFSEWGNRWLDLKRTGKIDAVLSAEKTGWKPSSALYPVPQLEIQANPYLVQNPGY